MVLFITTTVRTSYPTILSYQDGAQNFVNFSRCCRKDAYKAPVTEHREKLLLRPGVGNLLVVLWRSIVAVTQHANFVMVSHCRFTLTQLVCIKSNILTSNVQQLSF
jgi:hypothetical protein